MTALRRLPSVLTWLLLAAVLGLLLAIVLIPRVMGWVPLTILSGSMEPTIPTGSQVVVEPIEGEEELATVQVGDVITFMPYPDDPTLVTHRVVARSLGSSGSVSLTTQGDANSTPDGGAVSATQARGVVRYHVPYAGYVANALTGEQKSTGVTVLAAGLLGYAALQLALGARRRPPTGRQDSGEQPEQGDAREQRATGQPEHLGHEQQVAR